MGCGCHLLDYSTLPGCLGENLRAFTFQLGFHFHCQFCIVSGVHARATSGLRLHGLINGSINCTSEIRNNTNLKEGHADVDRLQKNVDGIAIYLISAHFSTKLRKHK